MHVLTALMSFCSTLVTFMVYARRVQIIPSVVAEIYVFITTQHQYTLLCVCLLVQTLTMICVDTMVFVHCLLLIQQCTVNILDVYRAHIVK